MTETGLGLYPVHDPEMPEVVEALKEHIERLGHTYAHNQELNPMDGARRIGQANDLYLRLCESLAELQRFGRVAPYSDEARRKMLMQHIADWERFTDDGGPER